MPRMMVQWPQVPHRGSTRGLRLALGQDQLCALYFPQSPKPCAHTICTDVCQRGCVKTQPPLFSVRLVPAPGCIFRLRTVWKEGDTEARRGKVRARTPRRTPRLEHTLKLTTTPLPSSNPGFGRLDARTTCVANNGYILSHDINCFHHAHAQGSQICPGVYQDHTEPHDRFRGISIKDKHFKSCTAVCAHARKPESKLIVSTKAYGPMYDLL